MNRNKLISLFIAVLIMFNVALPLITYATEMQDVTMSSESYVESVAENVTEQSDIQQTQSATEQLDAQQTQGVAEQSDIQQTQSVTEQSEPQQTEGVTPQVEQLHQVEYSQQVDDLSGNPLVEAEPLQPEQMQAMNLQLIDYNQIDYAGTLENKTVDGSSINRLDAAWITADTADDGNPRMLTQVWRDNNLKSIQLRWNFSLSGQHDYPVGSVQFSVPKYFFQDRFGKETGVMSLAVPMAPDNTGLFSYVETEDAYVLTNTKVLSAATSGVFEGTIKDLKPSEIKDMVLGYQMRPFAAELNIITNGGNLLSATSNALYAQIDTRATVKFAVKRTADRSVRELYPSSWPQGLKPSNPDDFVYVAWTMYAGIEANQYYTMDIKDTPLDHGGFVLGYRDARTNNMYTTEGPHRLFEAGFVPPNANGSSHVVVYTAYPKSSFEYNKIYTLNNEVKYTLTSTDDGEVTEAVARANVMYNPLKAPIPTGHFIVNKYGDHRNNSLDRNNYTIYSSLLNDLREGLDSKLLYQIQAIGFGMPWTIEKDADLDPTDYSNYGKVPYTMVVTDDEVKLNDRVLNAGEYTFKSLEFGDIIQYAFTRADKDTYGYYDSNGVVTFGAIGEGSYGYFNVYDVTKQPIFTVSVDTGDGVYKPIATVDFTQGTLPVITGAGEGGTSVIFPEGTLHYKVETTTTNAGLTWNMYPEIEVKATNTLVNELNTLFEANPTPQMFVFNNAVLDVYVYDQEYIHINSAVGRNIIQGFGTGAVISKSLKWSNDTSLRAGVLEYTSKASYQTNVADMSELRSLISDGRMQEQTSATWYDLLPEGIKVDVNSIKGRPRDTVTNIEIIEDYKGSNRTLVIVDMQLTPTYVYKSNTAIGQAALVDEPELYMKTYYSWEDYKMFGRELENNVVYESHNDSLGTITDFKGEPDNPLIGNNKYSKNGAGSAFELLTDLNSDNDNPSYIYAKAYNKITLDTYAISSLRKSVDVNREGRFGDGLGNANAKNVYEGEVYTYQLRVTSAADTMTKDIIIYDNLEQHIPTKDTEDFEDSQWIGKFLGVNVSELKSKGVNPVVYYSTKSGLVLDNESNRQDMDLTNNSIWSMTPPSDLSTVKAIAVDIRYKTNGEKFVLQSEENVGFYINMKAPVVKDFAKPGEEEQWYDSSQDKGEKGLLGGAHAYNNASMSSISIKNGTTEEINQVVRHDYVKVGLKPHNVTVTKEWDDADNQDDKRTDSVNVTLYANNKPTDYKTVLNADNKWTHVFKSIPRSDADGNYITYSVVEDPIEGYTPLINMQSVEYGVNFNITNKHIPEKIELKGTKVWTNDSLATRPESINLDLYKNGSKIKTINVKPNDAGEWHYSTGEIDKYEKGQLIKYELKEQYVPGYVSSYKDNIFTNDYKPYGDIKLTKSVTNSTPESKNNKFEFIFEILDKDGNPDLTPYNYINSNGTKGVISTGGSLFLKENETVTIQKVSSESKYTFTEKVPKGYVLITDNNVTNVMRAGAIQNVEFTNDYQPAGKVNFKLNKKLNNKKLIPAMFIFDLFDEEGALLRAASNDAEGIVNFGTLTYGHKDVGKTYTYTIKERQTNKPGYVYDQSTKTVKVTVEDNGDGTLKVDYIFDNNDSLFTNAYKAKGDLELVAFKQIKNGFDVAAGQFSFEVKDKTTGEVVSKGTNDINGKIVFDKISYDEKSIGKEFTLVASEIAGNDTTMNYDKSTVEYSVKVNDRGDGTLAIDVVAKDMNTSDINNPESIPTFVNEYKPGSLKIQKTVSEGSPQEIFKFKVKFTGEGSMIPKGELKIEYSEAK